MKYSKMLCLHLAFIPREKVAGEMMKLKRPSHPQPAPM